MTARTASRLAWGVFGLSASATAGGLALLWLSRETPTDDPFAFRGEDAVVMLAYGATGAILAGRRPANPIGWLFLLVGSASGALVLFQQYATYALLTREGAIPGGAVSAWLFTVIPLPGHGIGLALVLLLFPDGRLPSARWRPAVWLVVGGIALAMAGTAVSPGPLRDFPQADNPFGVRGSIGMLFDPIADAGFVVFITGVLLCVCSVGIRFRGSVGIVRAQLKWFVLAGGLLTLAFLVFGGVEVVAGGRLPQGVDLLPLVALCAVPVATGVAVLRYRLYDIDRLISRTIAYTAVVVLLAAGYAGSVVALGRLLRPITAGNDLTVAASTLAVAALFRPLLRRVQGLVERRFNRSRYDAQRTIEAFAARLRDEIDIEQLASDLRSVVRKTIEPAHVSLWLPTSEHER